MLLLVLAHVSLCQKFCAKKRLPKQRVSKLSLLNCCLWSRLSYWMAGLGIELCSTDYRIPPPFFSVIDF